MKAEISCPILSSEKFSKEVLTDIVNSLEQLENCKNTIFNRLNTAFNERVNRLCDIKARIIRANKIITSYTTINEAITLKSKYHYPSKKHNYYTPTIIDQNATTINKGPTLKLNRIVLNDKAKLGSKSLAAKDKIVTYDKYLSFSTQFNDIVNELDKASNQAMNVRQSLEEFEPILNNVTSDFTFGTNVKIEYAKKQQYNPQQEINRGSTIVVQEEYIKEKRAEEEKRKKTIQQAPKSIIEKTKLKKYKKKRNKLKKTTSSKINFNLPTNIGLGGVAELADGDDEEEKKEDNNEDEEDEDDEDFQDDTQNDPQLENQDEEPNLPIDYIRYNNQSKINNQATPNPSYNNNYNQRQVNNNINYNNTSNNVNSTPNPVQTSNPSSTPTPPPPPPPPEPPKQTVVQPPPRPKAPSPPPPVPSSSSSTVQVIVSSSGAVPPPPPPPPPPPMVPTVPTKANEAKAVKKNNGPELSLEEELAKAMSGLKKTVKLEEKPVKKELSFQEQLALSRNKLKKAVIPPKPPEKKVNAKDLLSQQIKLRFQNLRMHEDEKEEDSDDDF